MTLKSAITNTIPITLFNRGQAGKIFEEVRRTGAKVVMKNNAAEAVIMSPEEYVHLVDELADAQLLAIAQERLAAMTEDTELIPHEQVLAELGIDPEELNDDWEPDIE